MVASIAVVDCAESLIGDIKEPKNVNNDQWTNNDKDVLQMIKLLFCDCELMHNIIFGDIVYVIYLLITISWNFISDGEQIDINNIIANGEIMQRFYDKSIEEIKQLYCFEDRYLI